MMRFSLLFLCFLLPFTFCKLPEQPYSYERPEGPFVKTNYGIVKGFTMESETKRKFYAFQGIPFAKPPVGELRFKPPVPIEPWNGILRATVEADFCVQPGLLAIINLTVGSEDCLYLNIYTPQLSGVGNKLLPVLVFVHGGAFYQMAGTTFFNGPNRFMDHDVVMVSFNYRLGPLGFLSTGDEASPGNYGLLDQVMVLTWLKENIRSFGGNPDSVTLMGISAGAMSASAHLVSPLSKGLFHRLILHSGVITAPLMINPNPIKMAKAFAKAVGCSTNSTQHIVNCLRGKDAGILANMGYKISFPYILKVLPRFVPVVDGIFLTQNPYKLLERGDFPKIPIIAGVNRDEGMTFYQGEKFLFCFSNISEVLKLIFDFKKPSEENEKIFIEDLFFKVSYTISTSLNEAQINYSILKKKYLKDFQHLKSLRTAIHEIITDVIFKAPLINFLNLVSQKLPAYMFTFEYRGTFQLPDIMDMSDKDVITHGDDNKIFFDGFYSIAKRTSEDTRIGNIMMSLWMNFINTGNPSPNNQPVQWDPITSDTIEYLEITKNFTMKSRYRREKIQFINDVFGKQMKEGLSLNIDSNGEQSLSDEFKIKVGNEYT